VALTTYNTVYSGAEYLPARVRERLKVLTEAANNNGSASTAIIQAASDDVYGAVILAPSSPGCLMNAKQHRPAASDLAN